MRARILGLLCGLLLLALPVWKTFAQEGLYVNAEQDLGAISPLVYGVNHGPWAFVPLDLLPYADAAGIKFIVFPGGAWGDNNDISQRQLDDLIKLCQRLGAEPSINVRLKNGTPDAAAELVRYANIEQGYNVRYWGVGNEPDLYEDYDTEQFNQQWRAIAEAMLAVDPDIILYGPSISQYPPDFTQQPKDKAGRDWMTEFLKANGDLVDIVSVHRYPFPLATDRTHRTTIDELRQNSPEWDVTLPNLRTLIRETVGHDLPIGVTEINSDWGKAMGGEASPDSLYNAIWWGDVLGRLIRQQVEMVGYFTLQSPSGVGTVGLFGAYQIRPTYYVYQLYQRFGSQLIYAASDDPDVSIYAAKREDGAVTLIIVNLSAEEKVKPLQVDGITSPDTVEHWLLDAAHNAELMDSGALGENLSLPPQSISLYIIPSN